MTVKQNAEGREVSAWGTPSSEPRHAKLARLGQRSDGGNFAQVRESRATRNAYLENVLSIKRTNGDLNKLFVLRHSRGRRELTCQY